MRRKHQGGQNARDWRRMVASQARRNKESVFTYKFGLEIESTSYSKWNEHPRGFKHTTDAQALTAFYFGPPMIIQAPKVKG